MGRVTDRHDLKRFIDAQREVYKNALAELRSGAKRSHWMWFIFPQLRGLGRSPTAQFYAIASISEARSYLDDPLLGHRLRESVEAVLEWAGSRSAEQIFGMIDAKKLRSSLTLFAELEPGGLFDLALGAFFEGRRDQHTLALLNVLR